MNCVSRVSFPGKTGFHLSQIWSSYASFCCCCCGCGSQWLLHDATAAADGAVTKECCQQASLVDLCTAVQSLPVHLQHMSKLSYGRCKFYKEDPFCWCLCSGLFENYNCIVTEGFCYEVAAMYCLYLGLTARVDEGKKKWGISASLNSHQQLMQSMSIAPDVLMPTIHLLLFGCELSWCHCPLGSRPELLGVWF